MLKNRFLAAFALSGLIAFTACEAEEEPAVDAEATVEESVAPVTPAPVVTDTMPLTDTTTTGTPGAPMTTDTGAAATGTGH